MDAIVQAAIGFLFGLFIPGFLIALIFFDELDIMEKIALGIGLSISITIVIGMLLGYNESVMAVTGGITAPNVWRYTLMLSGVLTGMLFIKIIYRLVKHGKSSKIKGSAEKAHGKEDRGKEQA